MAARSITLDETPTYPAASVFYKFTDPYSDIMRPLKFSGGSVSEASIDFLAKLAILAQRYLMPGLVRLSLDYLRGFLLLYRLEPANTTFLIHLIELAHSNGGETVGDASQSLKQKILQYTTCQWPIVKQNDEFTDFLGANPDIAMELMQVRGDTSFANAEVKARTFSESNAGYLWSRYIASTVNRKPNNDG